MKALGNPGIRILNVRPVLPAIRKSCRIFDVCAITVWMTGCLVFSGGCGGDGAVGRNGDVELPEGAPDNLCELHAGQTTCFAAHAVECSADGQPTAVERCIETGQLCIEGLGCRNCAPETFVCQGNQVLTCRADGSGFVEGPTCDSSRGMVCNDTAGSCVTLCENAAIDREYLGCEYWPTTTLNSDVPFEFDPAVIVANPQRMPAEVTVVRGDEPIASVTIDPGEVETIRLEWVDALKGTFERGAEAAPSAWVRDGAYRLRSSVPVTVYQFNPLEWDRPADCTSVAEPPGMGGDDRCFSFSNDASLLLPTHTLSGRYVVLGWPSRGFQRQKDDAPPSYVTRAGFVSLVAVDEGVTDVLIAFTAHVQASLDGSVRAFGPGEEGRFTLRQGDVLQFSSAAPPSCTEGSPFIEFTTDAGTFRETFCEVGPDYDLTGSEIRVEGGDHRVAVFAGHSCAFVPFDAGACDHLEEMLFPLETWDRRYIAAATVPLRTDPLLGEPNLYRILSGIDDNQVNFSPRVHPPITLGRGELLEFESKEDFLVEGSGPLLVGQLLVGQDYFGPGTAELHNGPEADGDPSLSLAIPIAQYRKNYAFLAPPTFRTNFVNVTAPTGATVLLDGETEVAGWRSVEGTDMSTARVPISTGPHTLMSTERFGVVVYGFGSYTSYMYPGGLDLRRLEFF